MGLQQLHSRCNTPRDDDGGRGAGDERASRVDGADSAESGKKLKTTEFPELWIYDCVPPFFE